MPADAFEGTGAAIRETNSAYVTNNDAYVTAHNGITSNMDPTGISVVRSLPTVQIFEKVLSPLVTRSVCGLRGLLGWLHTAGRK